MRGSIHAVDAEYRDLLTTSDATGGALLPQMFSGILVDARKFYGPIADKVMQKVTDNKGVPMKISYSNDTGNGLTLLGTEGSSSPAETDPAFVSALLGVDTVTGGLVKVSFQELQDSSFDLDAFIRSHFAVRYARGLRRRLRWERTRLAPRSQISPLVVCAGQRLWESPRQPSLTESDGRRSRSFSRQSIRRTARPRLPL